VGKKGFFVVCCFAKERGNEKKEKKRSQKLKKGFSQRAKHRAFSISFIRSIRRQARSSVYSRSGKKKDRVTSRNDTRQKRHERGEEQATSALFIFFLHCCSCGVTFSSGASKASSSATWTSGAEEEAAPASLFTSSERLFLPPHLEPETAGVEVLPPQFPPVLRFAKSEMYGCSILPFPQSTAETPGTYAESPPEMNSGSAATGEGAEERKTATVC